MTEISTQRVLGQPSLPGGGHHDDDPVSGGGSAGEGPAGEEGLVVGMGVERHDGVRRSGTGRLRILHVTDVYLPRLGGIELHVHDLARRQRLAGHDVTVVTATAPGAADSGALDLTVRQPPAAGLPRRLGFLWANRGSRVRPDIDVVHVHCSTFSPLAFLNAAAGHGGLSPTPTVVTVHSLWDGYTALYKAADHAIGWSRWPLVWSAVSHSAAAAVERSAVAPLDVHVVPNGIDLSSWSLPRMAPEAGHLRLVSVMRLAVRKRPLPLLRMWHQLRRRLPTEIRLSAAVIGDGPARPAMQRYLDRHAMSWVDLPGPLPREEVAQRLAASDLYVAPAKLESFGIAALEAHASGLPVIGRLGTGLSEFIRDGDAGMLCPSDAAMVAAMETIALDPGRLRPSADSADRIRRMSWPSVLSDTERLYALAGAVDPPAAEPAAGRLRPVGAAAVRQPMSLES